MALIVLVFELRPRNVTWARVTVSAIAGKSHLGVLTKAILKNFIKYLSISQSPLADLKL